MKSAHAQIILLCTRSNNRTVGKDSPPPLSWFVWLWSERLHTRQWHRLGLRLFTNFTEFRSYGQRRDSCTGILVVHCSSIYQNIHTILTLIWASGNGEHAREDGIFFWLKKYTNSESREPGRRGICLHCVTTSESGLKFRLQRAASFPTL